MKKKFEKEGKIMPRPKNKEELITAANTNYEKLLSMIENRTDAEKEAEYKDKFASPYQAANRGYIDDVIEPRNTRKRIIKAFEQLQTKKLTNPLKKHCNIPL